jgi:hypothetical protein
MGTIKQFGMDVLQGCPPAAWTQTINNSATFQPPPKDELQKKLEEYINISKPQTTRPTNLKKSQLIEETEAEEARYRAALEVLLFKKEQIKKLNYDVGSVAYLKGIGPVIVTNFSFYYESGAPKYVEVTVASVSGPLKVRATELLPYSETTKAIYE